jgi:hypothetical protein
MGISQATVRDKGNRHLQTVLAAAWLPPELLDRFTANDLKNADTNRSPRFKLADNIGTELDKASDGSANALLKRNQTSTGASSTYSFARANHIPVLRLMSKLGAS